MKLAFNGATTMKADLLTDIEIIEESQFEYLEIWAAKLDKYLESHSLEELKNLWAYKRCRPWSINSIEFVTFKRGAEYQAVKDRCRQLSEAAGELRCPCLVIVPSPLPEGTSWEEVKEESVRVLEELGAIAWGEGVALAFEFLGFPWCSVRTLDQCLEIVDAVNRENVGMILDTFHFYVGGSSLESIRDIDVEKLYIVHVSDCEDRPREKLEDKHRLLPGEGVIPLVDIMRALKSIGYDRLCSVELFRPEYWEWPPEKMVKQAWWRTWQVLWRAGYA